MAIIWAGIYLTDCLLRVLTKDNKIIQADTKSTSVARSDAFIRRQSASFVSPPLCSPPLIYIIPHFLNLYQRNSGKSKLWIIHLQYGKPRMQDPLKLLTFQAAKGMQRKCYRKLSFISFRLTYQGAYRHRWNAKWFYFHLLLSWMPLTAPVGYLTR